MDGEDYFSVQWFFRAEDTVTIIYIYINFGYSLVLFLKLHFLIGVSCQVIKDDGMSHDKKRLFYSTLMNDNLLDCIVSKVKVVQIKPNVCLKFVRFNTKLFAIYLLLVT